MIINKLYGINKNRSPYFYGIFLLHFPNPFLGLIFVLSSKNNFDLIYEKHIC